MVHPLERRYRTVVPSNVRRCAILPRSREPGSLRETVDRARQVRWTRTVFGVLICARRMYEPHDSAEGAFIGHS
jgi:hypothetical protein